MPGNPQYPVVNLIIDVQNGTDLAFIERARHTADALRERGIPSIWVSMDNRSQLYLPTDTWPSASSRTRDMAQLEQGGFFGRSPNMSEAELKKFEEFRQRFSQIGPRTDEAMFPKAFFSAFASQEDLQRPDMREFFTSQRQAEHAIDIDRAFHGQSLQDYLKSMGVKEVTVMGGNADVCVTETALGAAKNGFKATILTDNVVSRADGAGVRPSSQYEGDLRNLHERMLDSPQQLAADPNHPTKEGYKSGTIFSEADKTAIRNNVRMGTLDHFISSLPEAPAVAQPHQPQQAKHLGSGTASSGKPAIPDAEITSQSAAISGEAAGATVDALTVTGRVTRGFGRVLGPLGIAVGAAGVGAALLNGQPAEAATRALGMLSPEAESKIPNFQRSGISMSELDKRDGMIPNVDDIAKNSQLRDLVKENPQLAQLVQLKNDLREIIHTPPLDAAGGNDDFLHALNTYTDALNKMSPALQETMNSYSADQSNIPTKRVESRPPARNVVGMVPSARINQVPSGATTPVSLPRTPSQSTVTPVP